MRPLEHGRADGLACAHDRAQPHLEPLLRARERFHHHLERGREQERVADPVSLDERERALGIEAAAIADNRLAEVKGRQERVHQAARPCPVRGRPEEILRSRETVVRMNEARKIADQALLRHERALRRTRRAARVDEIGGVGGSERWAREVR